MGEDVAAVRCSGQYTTQRSDVVRWRRYGDTTVKATVRDDWVSSCWLVISLQYG